MLEVPFGNHPLQRVIVRMVRAPRWVWIAFALPVALLFVVLLAFGAAFAVLFLVLSAPVRAFRRLRAPRGSQLGAYRENVRVAVTSARVIDP